MSPPADIRIERETEAQTTAVEALHRRAFGESGEKIVALLRALRQAQAALSPISLVALRDDEPVGHVLLSAARLDATPRLVDVFTLSPLAVDPVGVPLVFLEGSPEYYRKHGFERASALGFRAPSLRIPDAAFQVARLSRWESWMTGSLVYSEPFWALDCVGLRDAG